MCCYNLDCWKVLRCLDLSQQFFNYFFILDYCRPWPWQSSPWIFRLPSAVAVTHSAKRFVCSRVCSFCNSPLQHDTSNYVDWSLQPYCKYGLNLAFVHISQNAFCCGDLPQCNRPPWSAQFELEQSKRESSVKPIYQSKCCNLSPVQSCCSADLVVQAEEDIPLETGIKQWRLQARNRPWLFTTSPIPAGGPVR